MTQELHKLKTQLDDSERDRSWLLNELSRTQTTTELLAVKIADAEAQRDAPPTPEPEDDGEDDDSAPVVVLSPRERLRRDREEKAEIAKRRKQKVQVAHQVANLIKECERYERQIAEERDRVRLVRKHVRERGHRLVLVRDAPAPSPTHPTTSAWGVPYAVDDIDSESESDRDSVTGPEPDTPN